MLPCGVSESNPITNTAEGGKSGGGDRRGTVKISFNRVSVIWRGVDGVYAGRGREMLAYMCFLEARVTMSKGIAYSSTEELSSSSLIEYRLRNENRWIVSFYRCSCLRSSEWVMVVRQGLSAASRVCYYVCTGTSSPMLYMCTGRSSPMLYVCVQEDL